jgi:iron complex outermembrane recepter protein
MSANPVLAAAIAAALISPLATAQTETGEAPAGPLEEVVVTAQKREELAQKTAISMSVYSGDQIAADGVHSVASLASVDPSLNMTTANGAGYMAVRGVASTDFTEIGDPAVSVSRDGFFTNRSYGMFASMYDVERICWSPSTWSSSRRNSTTSTTSCRTSRSPGSASLRC